MVINAASNDKSYAVVRIGSSGFPVFIGSDADQAAFEARHQRNVNKYKQVTCRWEKGESVRLEVLRIRKRFGDTRSGQRLSAWMRGKMHGPIVCTDTLQ
jgi:hypothetical protein